MKKLSILLLLPGFLAACKTPPEPRPPAAGGAQIANPASTHCIVSGGSLVIRKGAGGEYGVCVFKGGRECEEWAFFRGECR